MLMKVKKKMIESQDEKKYRNRIRKIFVNCFLKNVLSEIEFSGAVDILDLGCGEGFPHHFFLKRKKQLRITGVDLNNDRLEKARKRNRQANYLQGDIYSLKNNKSYDLLLMMEVLEHLRNPKEVLPKIRKFAPLAIFSVPYEPWFSIFSFSLGKYLTTLGKHPDHVNFWNKKTFRDLLKEYYPQVKISISFPWLIAVCKK